MCAVCSNFQDELKQNEAEIVEEEPVRWIDHLTKKSIKTMPVDTMRKCITELVIAGN
jgi:hypothetical protein